MMSAFPSSRHCAILESICSRTSDRISPVSPAKSARKPCIVQILIVTCQNITASHKHQVGVEGGSGLRWRCVLLSMVPESRLAHLRPGVDDVNLMQRDAVDHLFALLQLALWALHKPGGWACRHACTDSVLLPCPPYKAPS